MRSSRPRGRVRGRALPCGRGSAYAAGTVGSKQIKNGSVQGKDIKNGSVTGADVKNKSLTKSDFKAGQLPAGARGATGAQGPAGAAGATGPVGPSTVFSGIGGSVSGIGTAGSNVVTKAVPAGTYAVNASVSVNGANTSPTLYNCRTTGGTGGNSVQDTVSVAGGDRDGADTIPVASVNMLSAPGTIAVRCETINGGQTIGVQGSSLTAIRVGAAG